MKNQLVKLLMLSIVSIPIVFVGCNKDDGNSEKNEFIFGTDNFALSKGYQSYSGIQYAQNTYEFDIMLVNSGISYNSDSKNFIGKGNYINLTMNSFSSEYITPGLYTFDRFCSKDSLTFDVGEVGINYDLVSDTDTTRYQITKGTVLVKKRGNIYTLDFDLYTESNMQFKGNYTGMFDGYTINDNPERGRFTYQNRIYKQIYGALDYRSTTFYDPSTYEFNLYLTGAGITYNTTNYKINGMGSFIELTIFSSCPDSLKTGTYVFDLSASAAPFTISEGVVGINCDLSLDTGVGSYNFKSGTISISRNKEYYIISYEFNTFDAKKVIGSYVGLLDYHIPTKKIKRLY